VLYLGRLSPRKRLDVLVRAFALLTTGDRRLVIAGNDMGAGASARALVRRLGVENQTVFTGLLQGRERLEALADATVVVYPAEHEVFGLVPLEALLAGTPVVVAGDSGCGEVVSGMRGGQVVPHGDEDALTRALETVLGEPSRWRAAAATDASRVRSTYAGDVVALELAEMYRGLLS
jgi:glycosyltransferase involved in cell wall biosynthesis